MGMVPPNPPQMKRNVHERSHGKMIAARRRVIDIANGSFGRNVNINLSINVSSEIITVQVDFNFHHGCEWQCRKPSRATNGGGSHCFAWDVITRPWASYQICKIVGCACAGNTGNVFPATAGSRSRHASRHMRDARAMMHAWIANKRLQGRGKRYRHSRRMRNPQFCVSGKRPIP